MKIRKQQGHGKTSIRRKLAAFLAVCMTVSLMPELTWADTGGGDKTVVITEFEPLAEDIAEQEAPLGTRESELNLPSQLKAVGYEQGAGDENDPPPATDSNAKTGDDDTEPTPHALTVTGVKWETDELYDETAAGETFTFMAVLPERYILEGAEPPEIVVILSEELTDNLEKATDSNAALEEFAITKQPHDVYALAGQEVPFEVEATGGEITCRWQKGVPGPEADGTFDRDSAETDAFTWSDIDGADGAVYRFVAEEEDLTRNVYRCVLSCGEEELTTDAAKVKRMMMRANNGTKPTVPYAGMEVYANGVPIKIVAGTSGGKTNILYDIDGDGTIQDDEYLKITKIGEPGAAGYNLSGWSIYGGGESDDIIAAPEIIMTGGKVGYLCGGSNSNQVTGDTSVTVTGGTVEHHLYGGGRRDSATVTGSASVTVKGGWVDYLYGGSMSGAVTKNTSVTVENGTVNYLTGGGHSVGENTTVKMSGGTVGSIYGAGHQVDGDSTVEMTDGTVTGDLAGGYASGTVKGSTCVKMIGGTVKGNLYGSGEGTVTENTSVEMTGGTVEKTLYGGGLNGRVGGSASVKMTGGTVGNLYGGGNLPDLVTGAKTIAIGGSAQVRGVMILYGVDSFLIDPDLTGDDGCVSVWLPSGYAGGVIATGAVASDLAKIKLTGDGAQNMAAYFDDADKTIKVREVGTPAVDGNSIYANGAPLLLVEGSADPTKTVVYIDKDGNGEVSTGDEIFDPDGNGSTYNGTDAGNDLSSYRICGGAQNVDIAVASTNITMTGGKVGYLYGGGDHSVLTGDTSVTVTGGKVIGVYGGGQNGDVNGSTSITVSGGVLGNLYGGGSVADISDSTSVIITGGEVGSICGGGGFGANVGGSTSVTVSGGTVAMIFGGGYNANSTTGTRTVTVGGTAVIADDDYVVGIAINDGADPTNGVDSFVINPNLEENAKVYVSLPQNIADGTVIATSAVQGDLEKIELVGSNAKGMEAYFDDTDETIKVRKYMKGTGGTIESDTPVDTIIGYFGGKATVEGKTITLTGDVTLDDTVIFASGDWTLSLGEKKITYGGTGSAIKLTGSASLTVTGITGKISTTGLGGTTIQNAGAGSVSVKGGTVSAAGISGTAIYNVGTGSVSVEGGTVSAVGDGGRAIWNARTGKITIKENARITSVAKEQYGGGTIYLYAVPGTDADSKTVLEIFGGTVENTADGYAVYFENGIGVTSANVRDYYTHSGGTVTGKIHPEPMTQTETYTATVTVNRDGSVWADHNKTIKLKETGGSAEYANGASVPNGTYRIMADGADTSQTLTVNGAAANAQIDYYTVTFYDGTEAYGSGTAQQPQTVLKNGKAVKPASDPVKTGFSFAKWVTAAGGTAEYDFENTAVTQKTAVYASWTSTGQTGNQTGEGSHSSGSGSTTGTTSKTPSTSTNTATVEGGSVTTTTTTSIDNSGKKTTVTTQVTKDTAGNVTGSTTTVTTDNIQISVGEGVSHVTVRPDGSAMNSAAASVGATVQNPLRVQIEVPHTAAVNEFAKPEVQSVAVDVMIPNAAANNPNVEIGVTIGKETIQAAKDAGKNVAVTVRNENGTVEAVWSFDGAAMRNTNSETADVSLGLHAVPVQSEDPSAQAVKPLAAARGTENGLVLDISGAGRLTAPTKLTVPATNQTGIKAGDQVALYRHDPLTGTLVPVPGGSYTVDVNGNVTIDLPAKDFAAGPDRYVLLPVLAAGTVPPAIPATAGATTPYEIKRGDTLNKIAREYGCTVEELLELNQVDVMDLRIGQVIQLPAR